MRRDKIKTHVEVTPEDETGSFSIVHIKTRDRPGLLTDIVRTLKDLNVNVISAEVKPPTPMLTGVKRISACIPRVPCPMGLRIAEQEARISSQQPCCLTQELLACNAGVVQHAWGIAALQRQQKPNLTKKCTCAG